ncbi:MAG: Ldh family oxidoreductase [Rhodobacteraceae bacterium]|nr:Ldh family oxidoreductase [Paracoccaceae bacterium]
MTDTQTERLSLDDARQLLRGAFGAAGVAAPAAASVADALVAAEAEGQVGHGFSRLSDYVEQVRSGKVAGQAAPVAEMSGDTCVVVDACHGFAYPALDAAISRGCAAAARHGTAMMLVHRSHHCGALSVQVEKIARAGLIGLMVANAPAAIAPWGSNVPVFGTNPIAFAVPRPDGAPLVIDLSLSRVARGKVMHARKSGQPIPEGWALDRDGRPTTDAEAALAGTMLPIGEAKGTALALMVEILAATLTGANPSAEASSFFSADGPPPGTGQFLLALRPRDPDGFAGRIEALLQHIAGIEGARLPGTRRAGALARAAAQGIDVPRAYTDIARRLAGPDG